MSCSFHSCFYVFGCYRFLCPVHFILAFLSSVVIGPCVLSISPLLSCLPLFLVSTAFLSYWLMHPHFFFHNRFQQVPFPEDGISLPLRWLNDRIPKYLTDTVTTRVLARGRRRRVCLLVGCLTSQQQASVSQGRICLDNFACCHTEMEVADQTFYLTQSQYTDTGPTSPSADPITPGAWQGSHWSAKF